MADRTVAVSVCTRCGRKLGVQRFYVHSTDGHQLPPSMAGPLCRRCADELTPTWMRRGSNDD